MPTRHLPKKRTHAYSCQIHVKQFAKPTTSLEDAFHRPGVRRRSSVSKITVVRQDQSMSDTTRSRPALPCRFVFLSHDLNNDHSQGGRNGHGRIGRRATRTRTVPDVSTLKTPHSDLVPTKTRTRKGTRIASVERQREQR